MKNMKKPFLWLLCFLPVICLLVLYLLLAVYYRDTFPAGTWINGIYCTGKSVEEVNTLLCEATALTDIVVTDMEGKEETLSLKEAEGRVDYTASLQKLSEKKNPFFWIQGLLFGKKSGFHRKSNTMRKSFFYSWIPCLLYKEEKKQDRPQRLFKRQRPDIFL